MFREGRFRHPPPFPITINNDLQTGVDRTQGLLTLVN